MLKQNSIMICNIVGLDLACRLHSICHCNDGYYMCVFDKDMHGYYPNQIS